MSKIFLKSLFSFFILFINLYSNEVNLKEDLKVENSDYVLKKLTFIEFSDFSSSTELSDCSYNTELSDCSYNAEFTDYSYNANFNSNEFSDSELSDSVSDELYEKENENNLYNLEKFKKYNLQKRPKKCSNKFYPNYSIYKENHYLKKSKWKNFQKNKVLKKKCIRSLYA